MSRLSLIIADADKPYLDSLVDFISTNYSQKFQVSAFTKSDALEKHISLGDIKPDILLVAPDLCPKASAYGNSTCVILLVAGMLPEHMEGRTAINKYQHGGMLVSSIMDIYSQKCGDSMVPHTDTSKAKVIAVYSPVGGAGKTTIAAGIAVQCVQLGAQVFYLNLESVASTKHFLSGEGRGSLSDVFYYIRQTSKNMAMRLEGLRCIDPVYNIHYFMPTDSSLEMDEMLAGELAYLIGQLKDSGLYDLVVVDMQSSFDCRTIALLDACDEIFLIQPDDPCASIKIKQVLKEFSILVRKNLSDLLPKTRLIVNKAMDVSVFEDANDGGQGMAAHGVLPFDPGLAQDRLLGYIAGGTSGFGTGICRLIERFGLIK